MGNIFRSSAFFATLVKYEKRRKYLPILHEATCDNYFIVVIDLFSNVLFVWIFPIPTYVLYSLG